MSVWTAYSCFYFLDSYSQSKWTDSSITFLIICHLGSPVYCSVMLLVMVRAAWYSLSHITHIDNACLLSSAGTWDCKWWITTSFLALTSSTYFSCSWCFSGSASCLSILGTQCCSFSSTGCCLWFARLYNMYLASLYHMMTLDCYKHCKLTLGRI